MRTREPIWPVVALILGAALLVAGVAKAGPRTPVYIPPILHQDSQQPDRLLSRAFRTTVALRVPVTADWRLTQPDPAVCQTGCLVVRIAGRRAPSPQYVLELRRFPRGSPVSRAQITGPADTTPTLLADALLLKTSFLLRTALSARPAPRPAIARREVVRKEAPQRRPRFELGLGPTAMLGLDADFIFAGAEATGSLRIVGPLTLRLAAGFVTNGEGIDYYARFRALPMHLLVGAQWTWRRFQLGIFVGGTVMLLWAEFDQATLGLESPVQLNGLAGGLTAELRIALRVHHHVSVGLGTRASYVVNRLATEVSGSYDTAYFSMPEGLIQTTLDVAFVF